MTAFQSDDAPATAQPPAVIRVPNVALDVRTVMNQSLPSEIERPWRDKLRALAEGNPSLLRLVDRPADADWLIQVAALERTDIIYLVPAAPLPDADEENDELLRMSPPGELAIDWLKGELKAIAEAGKPTTRAAASKFQQPDTPVDGDESPDQTRKFLSHEGPAEDLKAEIVQEQSGIYHTPNRTQALLGTYGKVVEGNRLLGRRPRFEHRGLIQHVDRARRFTTVERQGRGSGKDFLSFMGNRQAWQVVNLTGQVAGGRENEVAFEIVGVRLDQNDVIKAVNADADAMNYFNYLRQKKERPCLVLENIVFTRYAASQGTTLSVGGSANTAFTSDSVGGRLETERTNFTQFTSPVVRCYQMYEVMLHGNQVVELVYLEP